MKVLILRYKATPDFIEALYVVKDDEAKKAHECDETINSYGYELTEMVPRGRGKESWLEEFESVINPPSDPHPNGN